MANIAQPQVVINYISQLKKITVNRNNQPSQLIIQTDYNLNETYNFQVINKINQIVELDSNTTYQLYGTYIDAKKQVHVLFYTLGVTPRDNMLSFLVNTYTSEYLAYVKNNRTPIDISIVAKQNVGGSTKSYMVLRDSALANPRGYIEGQAPTDIVYQNVFNSQIPVSTAFGAGNDINLVQDLEGQEIYSFAFGDSLSTNNANQFVIGYNNEPDATKAFIVANSGNIFTVDYEGNVEAGDLNVGAISATSITVSGEDLNQVIDDKVEYLSTAVDDKLSATEDWVSDTFETKESATQTFNELEEDIDGISAFVSGLPTDIAAKADQTDLDEANGKIDTISGQVEYLSGAIDQHTSDIGDLNNAVSAKANQTDLEALSTTVEGLAETKADKTEIPTGNAQLENTANYITSSQIPTSYVQLSQLDEYAKTDELSSYATSGWVDQNYAKKGEAPTDVYTKAEVNQISSALSSAVSGAGYLTEIPTSYVQEDAISDMATKTWVSEQGYLTEVPNTYALKTDIPTDAETYEAISGNIEAQITGKNYITSDALNGLASDEDLQYVSGIVSAQAEDITALKAVSGEVDYETVFDMLSSGDTDTLTITKDTTNQKIVLTAAGGGGGGDKTYHGENGIAVDNVNDTISISANFLSANALEGYATQSWVGEQGFALTSQLPTDYTTSAQVSSIVEGYDFATKAEIPTTVAELTDASDYALKSELPSDYTTSAQVSSIVEGYNYITGYTTGTGIDITNNVISLTADIPTNTNQLTNGAGFISAIALWFDGESEAQNVTDITFTSDFTWNSGDIGINAQGIIAANEIATESYVDGQVSGKADQSTVETLSTNLSAAITGVANDIPLSTSQLTNDSGFITASDIPAAPSTVYDKLSAGSNITLSKNDSTGVTTIAATGGGGGGASTISVTVEDRSTEQQVTAPVSSVYFTENGFNGVISNNLAQIQWKGIFGLDSNEDLIDYEKGIQWSDDFSVGTSEDHFTVSLTNPIPTNTSDLTNDSNFATSTYVQSASGNAVDVATGWVQEQDYAKYDDIGSVVQGYGYQTAADVQNAIGSSSGAIVQAATGAITVPTKISELTNDSNYISAITLSAYNASTMQNEAVQTTTIDLASTDFVTWNGKVYINDNKFDIPTDAEISGIASAVASTYIEGSTISAVSQLINDVGFVTEPRVSAIASAYAQGGGGGTTYTAGDGIDITNDEISVKLSGGNNVTLSTDSTGLITINATGGGSAGNIVGGAGIRVMQDGGNTIISIATASLIATPTAYTFDFRNTSGTVDFDYTSYNGNQNLIMSYQGTLPNGVTASPITSGYQFEYVSGANVSNTTSTITAYFDAYDITQPTSAEVQINTIGFVNAEISASTITSFVFDANNAETISAFTWDVVSGSPQNLTVEISGDLPDGVTSTLSIQNRTLTFSATSESLTQNGTKAVNVVIDGDNIERQVIALELTVQNAIIRTPLTFVGKDTTNAVKLTKIGNPHQISLQYSKNGGEWTTYNIEDIIEFGNEETVAFKGNNSAINVGYNNQYQFVMTGIIDATGNIQSLMGYSDTVADNCYYRLFRQCNSMRTAPQLPAMNLANSCYRFMFNECTNLITAPQFPATTLVQQCYDNMFFGCSNLTGCPNIAGTNPASNSCQSMFQSCPKFSYVKVNFTNTTMNVNSSTNLWLNNAASTGTVVCPTSLTINTRDDNTVPAGWTIERF